MSENTSECRICFERETPDNLFIHPCACKGTSRYIHSSCLESWRNMAENEEAKTRCMECGERYLISKAYPLETYPFKGSLILHPSVNRSFRNNIIVALFGSVLIYCIDGGHQTSLTVFSFGNNWYNNTITNNIKNENLDTIIPYYLSLTSFIQGICIFSYFYYKVYKSIIRTADFLNYIKYEIIFLNICSLNFLYLFWGLNEFGKNLYANFFVLFFLTMGALCNFTIPSALTVITKSTIKFLNTKKNNDTVLSSHHNPLNTVIEILPDNSFECAEQKYDELPVESESPDTN